VGLLRLAKLVALAFGLWVVIQPVQAASILWMSDAPPDLGFSGAQPELTDGGFVKLLQSAGHTVERFDNPESNATLLTQEEIDRINTNDLVIIGRATASGQFQEGQGDQWNTNIIKPLICMSPYLVRTLADTANRMGWFTAGNLPDSAVATPVTAVNPADPAVDFILSGVEMLGTNSVDVYDKLLDRNTSHITDPVVPGGRVLLTATFPTEGNEAVEATGNVIADFPAGTSVRSGLNVLAAYRMFFAGGSREGASAPNAIPMYTGRKTLTPAGESIFLKAVELALRSGVPPTNNPTQPIAITRQPVSASLGEGGAARFSVAVTGAAPRSLQWQRDTGDGVTFTNIPGAQTSFSASAFTIAAVLRGDNGARFRVVATNANNSVTSDVMTLTVTPDNAAPVPLSAASVTGTTVDIRFDEVIDNASGAFQNTANFRINAGQPKPTAATPRADGKSVVLTLDAAVGATFTVNVSNLSDARGNAIPAAGVTVNGTSLGMTMTAIGTPNPEGTSFALGPARLEVTGGGLHFPAAGGASDQFQFVHKTVTGDFDASVRVASMAGDGRLESVAQAILTARETADEFSAGVSVTVTPPEPGDDVIKAMVRLVTSDITNDVGVPYLPNGLPENAWMRITRSGDVFTAYRSTNGVQWVELGNVTVTLAPALEVGVGAVSHRNTRTMTATFSDLQIGGAASPELRLQNPSYQAGAFSASFQSQNGVTYTPEYKDLLTASSWTPLPSIAGDGTTKAFTNSPVSPTGFRFYRISRP
jgi:regulation of enolase protein 1 (concanavalin A-like superfamily)